MKESAVTIILTVRNSAHTIKNCIDSLLKQNYKNYKIYVTDAFSTDNTYEILKSYGKKIKLEQVKGNMSTAYNHMIKKVDTEFIAFTDGDCYLPKNWLENLMSGFKSDEIVAVAGFCKTPTKANKLQELIGRELEGRFKTFPKYICRSSTMNLAIRTKIAKKVKYDERLDVAQETDWGYRVTQHGKMLYHPEAVVYHHHRATWKAFFNQQMKYAKFTPVLYMKHKGRTGGDNLSKPLMLIQPFLFNFGILFLLFSFSLKWFSNIADFLFTVLLIIYIIDSIKLSKSITDFITYLFLFFVRTIAWSLGLLLGIIYYPKLKSK